MQEISPLLGEILSSDGAVELTTTGRSMEPMLFDRVSRVQLIPVREPLKRGDLPLYRRADGAWVLHRIVAVRDGELICCGDHQWQLEYGIHPGQVLGVVSRFARHHRWTDCNSLNYQLYWRVWLMLRPMRRIIMAVVGRLSRLKNGWKSRRGKADTHGNKE